MANSSVAPEIIAAITAVQSAMGSKVVAVSIKPAEIWTIANRSSI